MLKNKDERTSFLRNEKNWEVEYLTPDIRMLTLKLGTNLFVRRVQVIEYNHYFEKKDWYTQFTKFEYNGTKLYVDEKLLSAFPCQNPVYKKNGERSPVFIWEGDNLVGAVSTFKIKEE